MAQADKTDGIVDHVKFLKMVIRDLNGVQPVIADIDNLFALDTDGVVMAAGIRIKSGLGVPITYLLGDAQLDKGLKHPIDRGARYPAQLILDGTENLIGGRMILTTGQVFQYCPALDRHGQAALPATCL